MSKQVFLIQAGEKTKLPRFPLGCLALASYIRKKGYEPKVLDLRLDEAIDFSVKPLCICISSMSGPSLRSAIQFSKEVKRKHQEIPIIFGGHHASALPEQTINEQYIDAVVVGEGEKALIKVLKDIEKGKLKRIYYQEKINME